MAEESLDSKRLCFVGGLHRSGTTILGQLLAGHGEVSGFSGTPAPMDEGQHLQSAIPTDEVYGGPGRFAFDYRAHMSERSRYAIDGVRDQLIKDWSRFWDMDKKILLEKSPPNLIRARFLKSIFPGAKFIFIVRHPIATVLSTMRWDADPGKDKRFRANLIDHLMHWSLAHELFLLDLPRIGESKIVRFDDLTAHPETCLHDLWKFLDLEPSRRFDSEAVRAGQDEKYLDTWRKNEGYGLRVAKDSTLAATMAKFGYSLETPFYTEFEELKASPPSTQLTDIFF